MEHPDSNQHIHCGSLGKEREKGEEHFTNFMKDLNINIQAFQQTPSKMNSKNPILRHMMKFLESKIQRENLFIYFWPCLVSLLRGLFSGFGEQDCWLGVMCRLLIAVTLLLLSMGSRHSSVFRLKSTGSIFVAHGLSCSQACGIPNQGSNSCLLHG